MALAKRTPIYGNKDKNKLKDTIYRICIFAMGVTNFEKWCHEDCGDIQTWRNYFRSK